MTNLFSDKLNEKETRLAQALISAGQNLPASNKTLLTKILAELPRLETSATKSAQTNNFSRYLLIFSKNFIPAAGLAVVIFAVALTNFGHTGNTNSASLAAAEIKADLQTLENERQNTAADETIELALNETSFDSAESLQIEIKSALKDLST